MRKNTLLASVAALSLFGATTYCLGSKHEPRLAQGCRTSGCRST